MFVFTAAALSLLLLSPTLATTITTTIPNVFTNGSVVPETVSDCAGVDSPKLTPSPANDTSYDWWYFDAVSPSHSNASVVVIFYNAGEHAFLNEPVGGPLSVSLSGTFDNGTMFGLTVPANASAVFATEEDDGGVSAVWGESGFSFTGTDLNAAGATYVVTVDAPGVGVKGTVTFTATAPPHYPCGPMVSGASEEVMTDVWWSNAVPDANAVVDLTIGDAVLQFDDGIGYHDKNWGDVPFTSVVSSWYWGHARLGPYSIVWFNTLDTAGAERFSGYVVEDGEVLGASCASGAATARPWGANSEYPPTILTGLYQGLEVTFELGGNTTFVANVTTGLDLADGTTEGRILYARNRGTVSGGLAGNGTVYEGTALFEEFKFDS